MFPSTTRQHVMNIWAIFLPQRRLIILQGLFPTQNFTHIMKIMRGFHWSSYILLMVQRSGVHHLGCINLKRTGINYQPQLANAGFLPSTVVQLRSSMVLFFRKSLPIAPRHFGAINVHRTHHDLSTHCHWQRCTPEKTAKKKSDP